MPESPSQQPSLSRFIQSHLRLILSVSAVIIVLVVGAIGVQGMVTAARIERMEALYAQRVADIEHQERDRGIRTRGYAMALTKRVEEQLADVPPLTAAEKTALRQFLNPVHLGYAKSIGVDQPPASREDIAELIAQDELVRLEEGRYYELEPMTHSVPAVVEPASEMLDELGRVFHGRLEHSGVPELSDGKPHFTFVISSATRSRADQRSLRGVNSNAASNSAHQFGTTVDILYTRFGYEPQGQYEVPAGNLYDAEILTEMLNENFAGFAVTYDDELAASLGRALLQMQDEGDVVAVYERRQPVFHITTASSDLPDSHSVVSD